MGSYNIGNKHHLGKKHSEETKKKISKANKGKKPCLGKKHSEETLAKLRAIIKTEEQRKKISESCKKRLKERELYTYKH